LFASGVTSWGPTTSFQNRVIKKPHLAMDRAKKESYQGRSPAGATVETLSGNGQKQRRVSGIHTNEEVVQRGALKKAKNVAGPTVAREGVEGLGGTQLPETLYLIKLKVPLPNIYKR